VSRLPNAYFPGRTLLLGISEVCLVSVAFALVSVQPLAARVGALATDYEHGFLRILLASAAFVTCMYYFDLYDSAVLNDRRAVQIRLAQALATACGFLVLLYALYPSVQLDRRVFLIGSVLGAALLFLWRKVFSKLNSLPHFADRALIVGEGSLSELLRQELESRPELGIRVVGRITDLGHPGSGFSEAGDAAESGTDSPSRGDLARAVEDLRANRIVVAMGERRSRLPVELLFSLKCRGVDVQEGSEVYEAITGKVPIESVRLSWLLFTPGYLVSRFLMFRKRCVDIAFSLTGLICSLPLGPFVIAAIKLDSRGPVFYRQKRTGKDGVVFDCYKLRTMRADAEADTGPVWAADDDPRITKVGRFLRQSRMDEIPQLWNVLRGDMSLVGPRPERPEFTSALMRDITYYSLRHTVRPGITGWAQIRYKYGNSVEDAKQKLRYDLFYIKNMSIGLDLLIFLQTLKVIILSRGAK